MNDLRRLIAYTVGTKLLIPVVIGKGAIYCVDWGDGAGGRPPAGSRGRAPGGGLERSPQS